jgi:hypothetical protein
MPRGGKRPGAGRPRKPIVPKPAIGRFDLIDRLRAMPSGSEGQRGRFVMAMAAYGAAESEIAAVLDITASELLDCDLEHMLMGRHVARANLLDRIWRKAEAGSATACIWVDRQMRQRKCAP